jgi:signal transduction histidine kinase
VQHASATEITVHLSYLGNATRLAVSDNGRGMCQDALTDNGRQGQGMANMQHRARLLGGDLVLENKPGQGLCLELTIPCDGHKDAETTVEAQEAWA